MITGFRLALFVVFVALVVSVPTPSAAGVDPGTRVRVTILARAPADSLTARGFEPGDRIVGTLLASGPRGLVLSRGDDSGDTLAIPRSLVAGYETSSGRHGRAGRGALIGLLAGGVAGVGIGLYFVSSEDLSNSDYPGAAFFPFALGVGGAVGGLGLGALIGSFFHTDRWKPAVLPSDDD